MIKRRRIILRRSDDARTRQLTGVLNAQRSALLLATAITFGVAGCASQGGMREGHSNWRNGPDASGYVSSGQSKSGRRRLRRQNDNDNSLDIALRDFYAQWAGTPYRYGGRSSDGIDCSSFVRHTLSAVESFELPRTTTEQAQVGFEISRNQLEPGDLVFFKTGGSEHHVGIYLDNGRFMHASSTDGVTISRLDNVYWRSHYWQARRVVSLAN